MKISKGTLFKRKNSPFLYLNISINGVRYVQKTKYYHDEIQKVQKDILPYLRQKILNGEIILNNKKEKIRTFSYYSNLYLNSKKFLKSSTLKRYFITVLRFDKIFGNTEIDKINASEIKNYLFSLNIRSLTFRNYLYVLRDIFNEAILDDIINVNPCLKIKLPKNNDKKEIEPFSINEVNIILSNSSGFFQNFLATAFYSGCRTGELFALKWQNIDLDKKLIYIDSTRGDYKEGTPKSGKNRYIPIFNSLIPYLEAQYKITGLNTYVFLSDFGKPLRSSNILKYYWYPLLKRLKLPKKVLYNTRHTFATNMINSQQFTLNQIASWLGHSNIRMLVTTYNKYIDSELQKYDHNIDIFSDKICYSSIKKA